MSRMCTNGSYSHLLNFRCSDSPLVLTLLVAGIFKLSDKSLQHA